MSFKQPTGQEESCRWTLFTRRGCAGTTPEGPRPRPPRAPAGQPPAFSSVQAAVWVPSPRARARQGDVVTEARAHAVDQRPCSPGLGVRGGPARCPKPDFPRRTGQPAREGRRCVSRRFPGPSGPGCQVSVFTALIRLNWPCAGGLHLRTQAADDGLVDGEFWPPRRPLQHLAVLDDSIPEVFIELQKTCTHIDNNRKVSLDTAARGRLRQNTGRSPLSLSTVPPVALATPGAQGPLLSSLRIRHLTGPRASSVRCPPAQRAADVQCRDGGLPPCPPRTPHSSPRPERGRARRGRASTHPWIKLSHCCLRTDGGRLSPTSAVCPGRAGAGSSCLSSENMALGSGDEQG